MTSSERRGDGDGVSEYLWTGAGPGDAAGDADVRRLEMVLRPLGLDARPGADADARIEAEHAGAVWSAGRRWLALAAMVALAVGVAILAPRREEPGWAIERLEGEPVVGARTVGESSRLRIGEWLTTDGGSRAQVEVASLGSVTVEGGSRLRVVRAGSDEKRMELARGTIHAFIVAPPRLFFVDTPAAVAADMGCAYTLEVGKDGAGELRVTVGWVELERRAAPGAGTRAGPSRPADKAIVVAGAVCRIDGTHGPGTPHFADSPAEFIRALNEVDAAGPGEIGAGDLAEVVRLATRHEAMALWHLLPRVREDQRGALAEALARLEPVPAGVDQREVLELDSRALEAWWRAVRHGG